MNIKERILENEIRIKEERIKKLQEFGSPEIVLKGENELLAELKSGNIKISGDVEVLTEEVISVETKKGRGGLPYVIFNDCIYYFPFARYGRYITLRKDRT